MLVTNRDGIVLRVNGRFYESDGLSAEVGSWQRSSLLKSGRHDRDFYENLWRQLLTTTIGRA